MELYNKETSIKEFNGVKIKFYYPTVADKIKIESDLVMQTRGQIDFMAYSANPRLQKVVKLAEAINTLKYVAIPIDRKDNIDWNSVSEDLEDEVLAFYDEYLEWRELFRSGKDSKNEGGDKAEDRTGIAGSSI